MVKAAFVFAGDCWDSDGLKNRCAAGAIYNYTSQLTEFSSSSSQYNLTEALLFLSHFVGDIHQPLHVGFASDRGGNTIKVYWYNESVNLHHVWDTSIIVTSEERFYNSSLDDLVDDIGQKITEGYWKNETAEWERCSRDDLACPDTYASESIKAACKWAYRNATPGSYLADEYFLTRMPIVETRLAQGGVRLAGILNRIFAEGRIHNMAFVDA
ncbi:hypothetical protein KP509_29G085500 [Ceratopteris richardii]|uniref:Aspergillus nuclease S1 n=1 Tax=Ceratopteris richardii TaxID=49495 RepID=A0A8T2RAI3_CERRI|nr:hypothetical protein KP509_29G085500 [Ceratopteris richardii]